MYVSGALYAVAYAPLNPSHTASQTAACRRKPAADVPSKEYIRISFSRSTGYYTLSELQACLLGPDLLQELHNDKFCCSELMSWLTMYDIVQVATATQHA